MTNPLSPSRRIVSIYRDAFAAHGRTEAALCWGKGKQAERFVALCAGIADAPASLLDFGCGLGDLAVWLRMHLPRISYTGADVLAEFVEDNKHHVPEGRFLAVSGAHDITERFDHVVCCGVFNLDPDDAPHRHWRYIRDSLVHLFSRTRISLHVDFLADDVDYRQPNAYHQNLRELLTFVESAVSRRYVLNRGYMPYEYCIAMYADQAVDPVRNIYARP